MALSQVLAQNYSDEDRRMFLHNNCDATENLGYMRQFSADDTALFKDELADLSISMADLEQELKDISKTTKTQLDPLKKRKKLLLSNIKQKAEYVNEECYKFIDHESSMAGFYSPEGILISSRPLKPEERQRNIFQPIKTGTND